MAFPEAWQEVALIEVQQFASSTPKKWQFHAITETIDIDEGEAEGESIPTLAGGRVWKDSPRADGSVTLEMYSTELDAADDANDKGLFQQFAGGTYDAAEPLVTDTTWGSGIDRTRDRFAINVLWTNDTTPPATASAATAASTDSLRFTSLGCRMTVHSASFTDGVLKVTATFKFPAFNKAGSVRMCRWESGDQTALVQLFTNGEYDDEDSYT